MMKSKRRIVKVAVACATVPVLLATTDQSNVSAEKTCSTQEECNAVIQNVADQIEEIEKETASKEQNLAAVEKDIDGLIAQVEETTQKIQKTETSIKKKESEIKTSEKEIKRLNTEISALKEKVGVRIRVSDRLKRSNLILNWISEADSLADLIQTMQTIKHFAENDSIEMDDLKQLVSKQNALRSQLKEQQASLVSAKQMLESDQAQLEKDKEALELKREEVKKEIQALESEKLSAQEAKNIAEEQKALLERLAEEERKRQEEEERKKQEALQQSQQAQTQEPEQAPSNNTGVQVVVPSSTTFIVPLAKGYVSCEFMCYSGHNGIDMGNNGNTSTPVLASASGIVTRSGWHRAYGNHVMITHNINGKIYTTVYAHMHTTPYVSVGDTVSQGQQIGTMGNTGNSFGAHLHFELYEGYYNYPHSVNPRKYINFPSRW